MKASTWLVILSAACFGILFFNFGFNRHIPSGIALLIEIILMVSFIVGAIERATDSICACIVKRNLVDELAALKK